MLHIIIGSQGGGKTLLAVRKAKYFYSKGSTVYSNVKLNFPFKQILYEDIIECKYNNAMVLIDEAHLLLNSRRSQSKVSVEVTSSFISQIRKQGLEVYLTTQKCGNEKIIGYDIDTLCRKLDVNLRDQADYIYFCERWVLIDNIWHKVQHNQNFPKKYPIMINVKVLEVETGSIMKYSFIGNDLFKLYDTKQIIKIKLPKKLKDDE